MQSFLSPALVCVIVLLNGLMTEGSEAVIVAEVWKSAALPCHFPHGSFSSNSCTVTWSRKIGDGVKHSVYTFHNGKSTREHQTEAYRGRSSINESKLADGDATLILKNLSVPDEGEYECLVFMKSKMQKTVIVQLRVAAPFSQPSVSCEHSSGHKPGEAKEFTLSCSSEGGYPKGQLLWILENQTPIDSSFSVHSSADAAGLFALHSQLSISRALSRNLSCVLLNPSLQQNLSTPAVCVPPTTESIQMKERQRLGILVSVLGIVCLCLLPLACTQVSACIQKSNGQ
ncbi:CD276 antigen isoform X2 [Amia ocellicauda]|uniref:CD276 antigen isoform X2 n=1 Tax=Amia ocellicauda TaxID=2972642 RepID=UPI003463FD06